MRDIKQASRKQEQCTATQKRVRHEAEGGSRQSLEGPEKLEDAALPDVFAFSENQG